MVYYGFRFDPKENIVDPKGVYNNIDSFGRAFFAQYTDLIIIDPLNANNNVAKSCYHFLGVKMAFIISLSAISEDCECGCHYCDNNEEYSTLHVEHCFLKRIFHAVKRLV